MTIAPRAWIIFAAMAAFVGVGFGLWIGPIAGLTAALAALVIQPIGLIIIGYAIWMARGSH